MVFILIGGFLFGNSKGDFFFELGWKNYRMNIKAEYLLSYKKEI